MPNGDPPPTLVRHDLSSIKERRIQGRDDLSNLSAEDTTRPAGSAPAWRRCPTRSTAPDCNGGIHHSLPAGGTGDQLHTGVR